MVRNEDAHRPAADTTQQGLEVQLKQFTLRTIATRLRHSLVRRLLLFYTFTLLFPTTADRR